jgi:hypothetical protein
MDDVPNRVVSTENGCVVLDMWSPIRDEYISDEVGFLFGSEWGTCLCRSHLHIVTTYANNVDQEVWSGRFNFPVSRKCSAANSS